MEKITVYIFLVLLLSVFVSANQTIDCATKLNLEQELQRNNELLRDYFGKTLNSYKLLIVNETKGYIDVTNLGNEQLFYDSVEQARSLAFNLIIGISLGFLFAVISGIGLLYYIKSKHEALQRSRNKGVLNGTNKQ